MFENADGDHMQTRSRGPWREALVTCNNKVGRTHLNMSLSIFSLTRFWMDRGTRMLPRLVQVRNLNISFGPSVVVAYSRGEILSL